MKKIKNIAVFFIAMGLLGVSCSKGDDGPAMANLTVDLVGIEPLTGDASYEGWIIVDGSPISTGKFTELERGHKFLAIATNLSKATGFMITIEPKGDTDPKPSNTKLVSGDFNGTSATLNSHSAIADFSKASGEFVLASPTDNDNSNDQNGVWFMNPNGGTPLAGLKLPNLTQGWKYEGWVIINDKPVSTGTFSSVTGRDDSSPYSNDNNLPPSFPGEDFLNNAPSGLIFPKDGDVKGKTVVISVEPVPDNDQATPFFIKPLKGVAGQLLSPTVNKLAPNGNGPVGTVKRP